MAPVSTNHLPNQSCSDLGGEIITLARRGKREPITIYHPLYKLEQPTVPESVGTEEAVRVWIRATILKTAQRILNVSDPSTSAWVFGDVYGPGTQSIKADFTWQCNLRQGTEDDVIHRLIVEVKSPCRFYILPLANRTRF